MKAILLIGMIVLAAYADVPKITLCPGSDSAVYQVDLTNTKTDPSNVQKGNHITLYVNGVVTDDVQLSLLELDVYWGSTFLQNVTAKETDKVAAGNPY